MKIFLLINVHYQPSHISLSLATSRASLLTKAHLMPSCKVRNFQLMNPHAVTQYQPLMIFHCITCYLGLLPLR
ncbi:hypothetical protein YDC107_5457 [Escherichia phage YDC107_2]|nr:hypothetical protein YDC107_5457 [Escherichia phage YDC107_2]